MAQIIICDGCKKEAPALLYSNEWRFIKLTVKKGYTHTDEELYTFHVCSQKCFNAAMRWISDAVCQGG